MGKQYVYEFLYNPDIYENCSSTISIHKTRRGAEMAMEFHKAETKKKFDEMIDGVEEGEMICELHYDDAQRWDIRETELQE